MCYKNIQLFKVNMLQHLHFDHFVPLQKPHNVPRLPMLLKARRQLMWRHSKSPSMTAHHVIWALSLLYYQLYWLFFVYCLPFIYIIITEVGLNSSCIGINNIKKRRRSTCVHQNQFLSFHQHIPRRHLIRQFHHLERSVCLKR